MSSAVPILVALTPQAHAAIRGREMRLHRFPFRIGRESRLVVVNGALQVMERRKLAGPPNNDLYLPDVGPVINVSRQHLQIESLPDGGYALVDRGSACGTIVGNQAIGGGDAGGRCALADGNVIVIGTSDSPFAFKFVLRAVQE